MNHRNALIGTYHKPSRSPLSATTSPNPASATATTSPPIEATRVARRRSSHTRHSHARSKRPPFVERQSWNQVEQRYAEVDERERSRDTLEDRPAPVAREQRHEAEHGAEVERDRRPDERDRELGGRRVDLALDLGDAAEHEQGDPHA